jgi:hypothetical protein
LHAPSPSLQCHVCPFLTGAQARPALPRPTQTLFPFQVLHYMFLMLSLSHWQSVAFET